MYVCVCICFLLSLEIWLQTLPKTSSTVYSIWDIFLAEPFESKFLTWCFNILKILDGKDSVRYHDGEQVFRKFVDDGADWSIVGVEGKSISENSIYSSEDKTWPLP